MKHYLNYENCGIGKNSDPAKQFHQFPKHRFNWKVLTRVLKKVQQRKLHEAYYIMYLRPTQHYYKMGSHRMFLN